MGLVVKSSDTISTMAQSIKGQKLNKGIIDYITSPKFETGNFLRNELRSGSSDSFRSMLSNAERSSSIFEQMSSSIDTVNGSEYRGIFKKLKDFATGNTDNLLDSQYKTLIKRNILSGNSVDDAVDLAQKSIKDGNIGILAKLRGGSGKTTDLIDESAESVAKKISSNTEQLGKNILANADEVVETGGKGFFKKLSKHAGTIFNIASNVIGEWPKVKKAFQEGGIGNGIKQIVKSTVQIGLTEGLNAVATGLIGMIPVVGPALAASGIASTVLQMVLYTPCSKIAEAVTSLPIFKVEGVQTDTEAMNELEDLGYTKDQVEEACAQYGVSGAAELNELIQEQEEASAQTQAAGIASSNGSFSQWLNSKTYAMDPSTGLYV